MAVVQEILPRAPVERVSVRLQCSDCQTIGDWTVFEHVTASTVFKCPKCGSVKATFSLLPGKSASQDG